MARVLTVNAGSSSLKLVVVEGAADVVARQSLGAPGAGETEAALAQFVASAGPVDAASHRIVHGGPDFVAPVLVDGPVRRALGALADLAPLHDGPALAAVDAVSAALGPRVPAVACFDTAFHATLSPAAATYALPAEWTAAWGLRRYGFHGLSHQWASGRAAELIGRPPDDLRLVTCHLGSGSSLAAVRGGRSVDTTMGFTPMEGLVMGTRPGTVDPGLLVWLLQTGRLGVDDLAGGLEHRSGLAGLAGSADMRRVLDRAGGGDRVAAAALAVHDHRLRASIAAMVASMGGLDGIVFTGGVGEHAPSVRASACEGLGWLGIRVDAGTNDAARSDAVVSEPGSPVAVVVVTAREDLMLAAGATQVMAGRSPTPG